MGKTLPKSLTSYDLLKTLAVLLMFCDHIGHHFFPDEMWFRVIGRCCVPIWFFLIGYARTTDITGKLWLGGLLVLASSLIAGQYLLPLNILFTIMVLRHFRRKGMDRCLYSAEGLRGIFFILVLLAFPTSILVEYGTGAILFSFMGYIVRNREGIYETVEPKYIKLFLALSFGAFFVIQGVSMPHVSSPQAWVMFAGFLSIGLILWNFKPVTYEEADRNFAPSFIKLLQFTGRRTLEIYVAHILIFRAVCMYLYPEKYTFWDWQLAPVGLLHMFA